MNHQFSPSAQAKCSKGIDFPSFFFKSLIFLGNRSFEVSWAVSLCFHQKVKPIVQEGRGSLWTNKMYYVFQFCRHVSMHITTIKKHVFLVHRLMGVDFQTKPHWNSSKKYKINTQWNFYWECSLLCGRNWKYIISLLCGRFQLEFEPFWKLLQHSDFVVPSWFH